MPSVLCVIKKKDSEKSLGLKKKNKSECGKTSVF